jgi:hypothetical protein
MQATLLALAHAGLVAQVDVTLEQHLGRARSCFDNLDFTCAERAYVVLEPRLEQLAPALAQEARVLGAEIALSTERWGVAEGRLLAVLLVEPRFAPAEGAWPPRWRDTLLAARRRVPDRSPPQISAEIPAAAVEGAPLVIRARVSDPSGVERASVHVEGSAPLEVAMTSTDGASFQAVVPEARVVQPALTVWIEAHDAFGNGPARTEAQRVEVSSRIAGGAADRWWVWALAGGAIIAGGVATAVVLTTRDPGAATVDIVWPTR